MNHKPGGVLLLQQKLESPYKTSVVLVCAVQSSTAAEVEECAYDPDCRYALQWDKNMEYAFIYHFFGLLWTNQFIGALGKNVTALASRLRTIAGFQFCWLSKARLALTRPHTLCLAT